MTRFVRLAVLMMLTAVPAAASHAQTAAKSTAESLLQRADNARKSLRLTEALGLAEQAAALLEKAGESQVVRHSDALHVVGSTLVELGRPADAIELHKRAIGLREKARVSNSLLSQSFADLAAAYAVALKMDMALEAQDKAIERVLTPNSASFVKLYRLEAQRAVMLVEKLDYAAARKSIEFAVKGLEGRANEPLAVFSLPEALATYAVVLSELGQQADAESAGERAIQAGGKAYSSHLNHPVIANIQMARARVAAKRPDYMTAVTYAGRARDIKLKALGAVHPDVALATSVLYEYHNEAGWLEPLTRSMDGDLKLIDAALPDRHPRKAEALGVMARTLAGLSRENEAEALYKRALAIDAAVSGGLRSDKRAVLLNNLSNLAFERDRYAEAETLMKQSMEIAAHNHGRGSLEFAEKLSNLAMIQSAAGRPGEAITGLATARPILEQHYPPDHPTLGLLYLNFGGVFLDLGQSIEAEPRLLRSREILAKHLATHREIYIQILDRLIEASDALAKSEEAAKWRGERERLAGVKK